MKWKKVIVLPPEIAEVFILPTNMQTFIGDMIPPIMDGHRHAK